MKWKVIDKAGARAPAAGDYRSWKPQLAAESQWQCVYCCIHESQFGGLRNFHVEHYRPKSKFPELINDYSNLFYACGVCNSFKGDDWPSDPIIDNLEKPGYPCPAVVDYCTFLQVNDAGEVEGRGITGRYVVERLHLNRGYMVALRVISVSLSRLNSFRTQIDEMRRAGEISDEHKDEVIELLARITDFYSRYSSARPYTSAELR